MTATFLVTLTLDPSNSIDGLTEHINDLLSDELAVVDVKPWSRPSIPDQSLIENSRTSIL